MLATAARQLFGLFPPNVKQQLRQQYQSFKGYRLQRALQTIGIEKLDKPDINHLLHELRGQSLQKLPQGVPHFVSVGCAGTWYFNWINQKCRPQHHTGIEFYSPRPDDLPSNATWIANTAGSMPELGNDVADILFSGQNIEHLWPDDVVNFLLESHRVLKPDGLLVIDSPNRRITAKLQWNQPEHTVEFDVDEILELLHLAGFDVQTKRGLWLCEDPQSGEILPLESLAPSGTWRLARRVASADKHLQSSFIWWIEAKKTSRPPQIQNLKTRVREIYDIAWPERLTRLMSLVGREIRHDGSAWFDSQSRGGPVLYGPYVPLLAGRYTASFALFFPSGVLDASRLAAVCEIVASNGTVEFARREIHGGDLVNGSEIQVAVDFTLADTTFAVEFRVHAIDGVRVYARKSISLNMHADA
jgi:SAM-dependent methyltransferase